MMCACWILCFSSALTSSPLLIKDLVLTPVLLTISLLNIYIEYIPYVYNFLKAGQLKAGLSSFIQQPVRVHVLLNGAAYRLILVRGAPFACWPAIEKRRTRARVRLGCVAWWKKLIWVVQLDSFYLSLPYSDEGEWQSLVQLRSRSSERRMKKVLFSFFGCGKSLSCRAIAPDAVVDFNFTLKGFRLWLG